jgi:hypothetical protein
MTKFRGFKSGLCGLLNCVVGFWALEGIYCTSCSLFQFFITLNVLKSTYLIQYIHIHMQWYMYINIY